MDWTVALTLKILPALGCLSVFLLLLVLYNWQKSRAEAERKIRISGLYYEAYDELLTLVRERQHDMNNHISAIMGMLYTIDNYEELVSAQRRYLCEVMENNEEARLLLSIENPILVGFIYRKIQNARLCGIRVEYKIAAGEGALHISDYTLVEILGILFDNAMEALTESNLEEKVIRLDIVDERIRVRVCVANTSREFAPQEMAQFFQKGYSSKGKGHGIGLKKLKKIVLDLKGDIVVSNNKEGDVNFLEFNVFLPGKG